MLGRVPRGILGAATGAVAGTATVVIVGMLAWDAVVGPRGATIAAVVGALAGGVLRGFGDWPVRSLAGGAGGAAGGFFAVAAAEQSQPGSAGWALHGGLLGVGFAVLIAAVVGLAVGVVAGLARPR
jgi:hypothetical protein